MERLIIAGSSRAKGRSVALAAEIFDACVEDCPDDGATIVPLAMLSIAPCTGCDMCAYIPDATHGVQPQSKSKKEPDAIHAETLGDKVASSKQKSMSRTQNTVVKTAPCSIHDDMSDLFELLDAADELIVVSPVYFSGPPAQFKALLDRLQPYFWARRSMREHGMRFPKKRPLTLHVVGEGGDPHGFDPLVGIVRSAFACVGFRLAAVYDWVGSIDTSGIITDDARDVTMRFIDTIDSCTSSRSTNEKHTHG